MPSFVFVVRGVGAASVQNAASQQSALIPVGRSGGGFPGRTMPHLRHIVIGEVGRPLAMFATTGDQEDGAVVLAVGVFDVSPAEGGAIGRHLAMTSET